jgi:cbb3-type cytochrome oxidase subunit 1
MFLIFGVSYHILPRFRGRPLHSEGLAWFQLWVANIGLVGFLLLTVASTYWGVDSALRGAPAAVLAVSFLLFIYNMGRTLIEAPPQHQGG